MRARLLEGSFARHLRETFPEIHVLTDAERAESLNAILSARPEQGDGLWVFAYGSLIWNPAIHYTARRLAHVPGWRRSFCLSVKTGRGTPENPGLMLGLLPGGGCTGAVFRIPEDILADEVVLERGVRGIAEGIEAGEHVERDGRVDVDGVAGGNAEVLGEGALAVHADTLGVLAEVAAAGEAVAADAADDVALAIDKVAGLEADHVAADLLDHADKLVSDDHRHRDGLLGPRVPVVDVDVGAADRSLLDLDQHVVDAGFRHRDLGELEPGTGR
jgi:hypothetical protein